MDEKTLNYLYSDIDATIGSYVAKGLINIDIVADLVNDIKMAIDSAISRDKESNGVKVNKVKITVEPTGVIPEYATEESAAMDLRANLKLWNSDNDIKGDRFYFERPTNADFPPQLRLQPGGRVLIPTGIKVEIPKGFYMDVVPRSGLALKEGITVCNSPGTIDSDYRGDVGVIIINHGKSVFVITHGERIAQFKLMKVNKIEWTKVSSLNETARGEGGFGHTGKQ